MPEVNVDVEVYCAACGEGLCGQTESTTGRQRDQPQFRVDPCQRCLDAADEEGYTRGYDDRQGEEETDDA
jgi:hypothetical protein